MCVFVYVLFFGGNCLLEGDGAVERNFSMGDKSILQLEQRLRLEVTSLKQDGGTCIRVFSTV